MGDSVVRQDSTSWSLTMANTIFICMIRYNSLSSRCLIAIAYSWCGTIVIELTSNDRIRWTLRIKLHRSPSWLHYANVLKQRMIMRPSLKTVPVFTESSGLQIILNWTIPSLHWHTYDTIRYDATYLRAQLSLPHGTKCSAIGPTGEIPKMQPKPKTIAELKVTLQSSRGNLLWS